MRPSLVVLALLAFAACGDGKDSAGGAARQDTLTRRQRDSVIGASKLPGAGGVRGAMRAADSAAARRARADSIR